jgi:hypothetical protein
MRKTNERKNIMKMLCRTAVAAMLLGASAVHADWTKVGEIDDGASTVFVDMNTLQRSGDSVKLWKLMEYKQAHSVGRASALSARELWEIDCREYRARMLEFKWYSGKTATGDVVISNNDGGNWRRIVPGSVVETMWKMSCGRK